MSTLDALKSPRGAREMWKAPEEDAKKKLEAERTREVRFKVIQKEDEEVFETEEVPTSDSEESDKNSNGSIDEENSGNEDAEQDTEKKQKRPKKVKIEEKKQNTDEQGGEQQYDHLVKGVDIIDDEISTTAAFHVFRQLEELEESG